MANAKEIDYSALNQELDSILAKLQSDELDVNDAIALYERGMEITKQLETYLKTAENKITKLKASFDK